MSPPSSLGILLLSGSFERAHYAFMLAAGAGAVGRRVVLFATNAGCHALCADWSALTGTEQDAASQDTAIQARGVAGFSTLRDAAADLGTVLLACDSGLRIAGIPPARLLPGVTIAGIPTFLTEAGGGQLLTL